LPFKCKPAALHGGRRNSHRHSHEPTKYDTNDDVLRVAQSRAQTFAREQHAQLRRSLARHHSESEKAAIEAEKRHRSYQSRRGCTLNPKP
jgi:hypothetical protein